MYKPELSKAQDDPKLNKDSQSADKEDVLRNLASSLVLRQPEGLIRSPIIILNTEKTCVYNVLEKHLKVEALFGADRWWRTCKSLYEPSLEVGLMQIMFSNLFNSQE